jgi:hypothetical protein
VIKNARLAKLSTYSRKFTGNKPQKAKPITYLTSWVDFENELVEPVEFTEVEAATK